MPGPGRTGRAWRSRRCAFPDSPAGESGSRQCKLQILFDCGTNYIYASYYTGRIRKINPRNRFPGCISFPSASSPARSSGAGIRPSRAASCRAAAGRILPGKRRSSRAPDLPRFSPACTPSSMGKAGPSGPASARRDPGPDPARVLRKPQSMGSTDFSEYSPGYAGTQQLSAHPVILPGRITEPRPVQPGGLPVRGLSFTPVLPLYLSPPDPALSRSPHGPACLPGRPSHSPR